MSGRSMTAKTKTYGEGDRMKKRMASVGADADFKTLLKAAWAEN